MALDYRVTYPSQVLTDDLLNYPFGKPRNLSVPGDGTGTPLEAQWLRDVWGLLQAILVDAGVTPSGNPDTAQVSQYLDSLKTIFIDGRNGGTYAISGGLTLQSSLIVDGGASGALFKTGTNSSVELRGFVDIYNQLDVRSSATLLVDGTALLNGTISFGSTPVFNLGLNVAVGLALFQDGISVQDGALLGGGAIVGGDIDLNGNLAVQDFVTEPLKFSGTGRVVQRVAAAEDADMALDVATASIYFEAGPATTSARTYTLQDATAQNGDTIIVRLNRSADVTFKREDTSTITTYTQHDKQILTFIRFAGSWELLSFVDASP